jgi:hypothetical protein
MVASQREKLHAGPSESDRKSVGVSSLQSGEITMAYIPTDAEWYLADLIFEIRIEDEPRIVVHVNTLLVHASSPEDAYKKALALGAEQVGEPYLNPNGKLVVSRFVGLKELSVIHDKLEHGAELFFVEHPDMQPQDMLAMVQNKTNLSVFAKIEPSAGPDYASGSIVDDYKKATGRS